MTIDTIIRGGNVVLVDKGRVENLDIGIKGDKIAFVDLPERLANVEAEKIIDVYGLTVIPGIIDMHSHADNQLLKRKAAKNLVMQGITTVIAGNCGFMVAPIRKGTKDDPHLRVRKEGGFPTYEEFISTFEKNNFGVNIAPTSGHSTIREYITWSVEQDEKLELSDEEIDEMSSELERELNFGSFAITTGLEYPPGRNASTYELVKLARIASSKDAFYATHMRSEGDTNMAGWDLFSAVMEALHISRKTGVRLNISHLKADSQGSWWKFENVLALLEWASNCGLQVSYDMYPYTFAGTRGLYNMILPEAAFKGPDYIVKLLHSENSFSERVRATVNKGCPGWTNPLKTFGMGAITVVGTSVKDALGKNLKDIAEDLGLDPIDAVLYLLEKDEGYTWVGVGYMSEENIIMGLKNRLALIGTDSFAQDDETSKQRLHPREFGTYPRIFGRYVRELKALSMVEAVQKSTIKPALVAGLKDRGAIKPGYYADIVVFNPNAIDEADQCAFFEDPTKDKSPKGLEHILINGKLALHKGELTGTLPGRLIKK